MTHNLENLQTQATGIVDELFPLDMEPANEADSSVDRLVMSMSADLIDDFPASDPRWLKTVPGAEGTGGIGSTMSLLILHQLEDKKTALEVYISFLKEVGLWKRVSLTSYLGKKYRRIFSSVAGRRDNQ